MLTSADNFDPVGEVRVINTHIFNGEEDEKMKVIVDQLQSNIDLINKTRISVQRKIYLKIS